MKLAGFLTTVLAIPAVAQSPAPHGTRIGQVQVQYLIGPATDQGEFRAGTGPLRAIAGEARPSGSNSLGPRSNVAMPSDRGARVEFETWVEQPSRDYAESVVTGDTGVERDAGKVTVHRFVRDNFRKTYVTYTITLEAVPETETFRVAFSDAAIPYPVPQILRDGETVAFNLAMDGRTGRRMVDYIRVGTGLMRPRQEVARDVYAEDAQMTITQPALRVNGTAASLFATASGPVVRVDIPGQGRYALSFQPRADEGFERAGEVVENALVFSSGGNIFRIDCADRIANGSATYNIYARKE